MSDTPMCSWTGVGPDDEDRELFCDKPATSYVEDDAGKRHFSCDEHLTEVRSHAGGGSPIRNAQHLKDEGHLKVSPESAVRWE
ncbi:MAG: hypothetical protein L3K04_04500 [Thermoplasmata archaeon]|nr:hypothetical protein [Thermoplasmata archaeon]MCI4341838.1 hypothetical protein [Thermoplasmata archaeon]